MGSQLTVVVPDIFGPRLAEVLSSVATVRVAPDASDAALSALLGDADALVSGRFSAAMAAAAPGLRLIHTPGAGTDGLTDGSREHRSDRAGGACSLTNKAAGATGRRTSAGRRSRAARSSAAPETTPG